LGSDGNAGQSGEDGGNSVVVSDGRAEEDGSEGGVMAW
ncbi:hypothetical protein A2U01_0054793, partial [Trifolium medium]|nr:hypothetical protein [Trifolium medium]